jgi:hypothetical protein
MAPAARAMNVTAREELRKYAAWRHLKTSPKGGSEASPLTTKGGGKGSVERRCHEAFADRLEEVRCDQDSEFSFVATVSGRTEQRVKHCEVGDSKSCDMSRWNNPAMAKV